jgi:hypothetical protein
VEVLYCKCRRIPARDIERFTTHCTSARLSYFTAQSWNSHPKKIKQQDSYFIGKNNTDAEYNTKTRERLYSFLCGSSRLLLG